MELGVRGSEKEVPCPAILIFCTITTRSWEHWWTNPHFIFFFSTICFKLAMHFPVIIASVYPTSFHMFHFLSFHLEHFIIFPWSVMWPLTYGFFRCVFYNFQIFKFFFVSLFILTYFYCGLRTTYSLNFINIVWWVNVWFIMVWRCHVCWKRMSATALNLVFYECHLHQGSLQCSSDLCISSFFLSAFLPTVWSGI